MAIREPSVLPTILAEHQVRRSASLDAGAEMDERTPASDITCQVAPSLPRQGHRVP